METMFLSWSTRHPHCTYTSKYQQEKLSTVNNLPTLLSPSCLNIATGGNIKGDQTSERIEIVLLFKDISLSTDSL